MDLIIGSHVSFTKEQQLYGSVIEALKYNSTAFMIYTGTPQNTFRADIDIFLTKKGIKLMQDNNIDVNNVIVHAPYIINLANEKNMDFNINFLKKELSRIKQLGLNKIVLHPGSHVGLGTEKGINNIIFALNKALEGYDNVTVLLETMSGKGTEVGKNFDEIKKIICGIDDKSKIGVCLDTCHLNDAGYDLTNFDNLLLNFDKIIGLNFLKAIHINDSKNLISSNKDRHENIGYGTIGFSNLINIIYNEKLKYIPKILETPYINETPPYKEEIEMIRNKTFNNTLK